MYYYDPTEQPLLLRFYFFFLSPLPQSKRMERRQRDNKFLFTQSIYLMSPMGYILKLSFILFLETKPKKTKFFSYVSHLVDVCGCFVFLLFEATSMHSTRPLGFRFIPAGPKKEEEEEGCVILCS
jgi:hypothetical protein